MTSNKLTRYEAVEVARAIVRYIFRRPICGDPHSGISWAVCDRHPGHEGLHRSARVRTDHRTPIGRLLRFVGRGHPQWRNTPQKQEQP